MRSRRELQIAVLLCLLGSALVLFALGQTWYSFEAPGRLTIDAVRSRVSGSDLASGAEALGYVGLAGVVALAATKRWGRVLVGLLVLAAGVGVVAVVARVLVDGIGDRGVLRSLPGCRQEVCQALVDATTTRTEAGWAWLTLLGGLLIALSGLLVAVRGRRWAALSSSYEAPAARAEEPPATDKGVWDALDRGEDPTG
jgi:uncharacterized membrane protein (TIGR02234 family)